ncbi:MAG: hypothetical protein K2Q14_01675, partial [Gammaproteobacteria bacterium]|nr:hypothetical protein [Gammaproteobacteria bacterium]
MLTQCFNLKDWTEFFQDPESATRQQALGVLMRLKQPSMPLISLTLEAFGIESEAQNQFHFLNVLRSWLKPELPQGTLEAWEAQLLTQAQKAEEDNEQDFPNIILPQAAQSSLHAALRDVFQQAWPNCAITDEVLTHLKMRWQRRVCYQANLSSLALQSLQPDLNELLPAFYSALHGDEVLLREAAWRMLAPYAFQLPLVLHQSLDALLAHESHPALQALGQAVLSREAERAPLVLPPNSAPDALALQNVLTTLLQQLHFLISQEEGAFAGPITTTLTALVHHLEAGQASYLQSLLLPYLTHQATSSAFNHSILNALVALPPWLKEEDRERAVGALLLLLEDNKDWRIRDAAIQTLAALAPRLKEKALDTALTVLLALLQDKGWMVPYAAKRALVALAPHLKEKALETALTVLLPLFQNKDEEVRLTASQVVATLAPHLPGETLGTALTALLPLLQDKGWMVPYAATWALAALAPRLEEKALETA